MDPENFGKIIHLSTPYDQKTHGVKIFYFFDFCLPGSELARFRLGQLCLYLVGNWRKGQLSVEPIGVGRFCSSPSMSPKPRWYKVQ